MPAPYPCKESDVSGPEYSDGTEGVSDHPDSTAESVAPPTVDHCGCNASSVSDHETANPDCGVRCARTQQRYANTRDREHQACCLGVWRLEPRAYFALETLKGTDARIGDI